MMNWLVCVFGAMFFFSASTRVYAADYYVAQAGQTPGNFLSWTAAASNIQDAVDAAAVNDTVWVGPGHYYAPPVPSNFYGPSVLVINKALRLRSSAGRDLTIIDGEKLNRGVAIRNFLSTTNVFAIDGFTVTNGYATNFGGGIMASYPGTYSVTVMVQNCTITDNLAMETGGGLIAYNVSCALIVSNCVIRNNVMTNAPVQGSRSLGGGVIGGGGIMANSRLLLTDSVIHGNWAFGTNDSNNINSGGGGVYLYGGSHTLRNILMFDNRVSSVFWGSGIYKMVASGGDPAVTVVNLDNCTIVSNRPGYAIHARRVNWTLNVRNSIVYTNAPLNFSPNAASMGPNTAATNLYLTYSCTITNGLLGMFADSNITNNPAFMNWAGEDFRLSRGSPCINAGTNLDWMSGALDLGGDPRLDFATGQADMGCYEFVYPGGTLIMTR